MAFKLPVDLYKAETYEEGTPLGAFSALREQAPVHFHEGGNLDEGMWCVTNYADIATVAKDPARFSSHKSPISFSSTAR